MLQFSFVPALLKIKNTCLRISHSIYLLVLYLPKVFIRIFLQLYNKEKNLSITVYKVLPYQSKRNQEEVNDIFNKLAYNEERILKYDSDSLDTINREEDKVTFLRYFLQSDGSEDEKSGFIEAVSIFKADSEIWILSYMVPERNAYLLENILEYEKQGV